MIKEDTGTADIAGAPGVIGAGVKPDSECRGLPCFDVDNEHTFVGMSKGAKTKFKHWRTVTQSPKIADWAKQNKSDFYIHNKGRFILVKRGQK